MRTATDPARVPPSQDAMIAGALIQHDRRLSSLEATAGRIGADSIRGDLHISNNSITSSQIVAGSITADRLNVSSLDAISATLGNIVAGNITLNAGSWIRTAPIGGSVAYTEFSPAGIRAQNSAGVETFNLSSSTGILTATAVLQTGSTVPGGAITTGSLDLSKLVGDLATSVSTNYVTAFSDMSRWTNNAGVVGATYSIANVSDALSGGTVLRCNGYLSFVHNDKIPFDPTVLYRIRARIRQVSDPTAGNKNFLIGLQGFNDAGVTVANNWVAANFLTLTAGGGWTTVTGYIRGTGARFHPANDAALPTPVIATTKFVSPAIIANYLDGNGVAEFDYLAVDVIEIPTNSITSSKLYAGTVEADRIQAANVAAGAITAAKISATIAGGNLLSTATTAFEQDISGWSTASGWGVDLGGVATQDGTQSYYGTQSLKLVTTGANQGIETGDFAGPWRAGQTYTFSVYVLPTAALAMRVGFGNQASVGDFASIIQTVPANVWTRIVGKWSPTADRNVGRMFITRPDATPSTVYVDAVQIEHGDVPTAWRPYVSPVVIEGSRIVAADFRTALLGDRVQIDGTNGLQVYNSGVMTAQIKAGAGGLDLLSGVTFSPNERKIRFQTASGTNIAYLGAYGDGSNASNVEYFTKEQSNGLTASHNIIARQSSGTSNTGAILQVQSLSGSVGGSIKATANSTSGTQRNATIIDGNNASSFLKLLGGSIDRQISFGTGTVTFSGGNASSATVINHGLPSTPICVFCQFHDTGNLGVTPVANVYSVGASQFTVQGVNYQAATGWSPSFWWIAFS